MKYEENGLFYEGSDGKQYKDYDSHPESNLDALSKLVHTAAQCRIWSQAYYDYDDMWKWNCPIDPNIIIMRAMYALIADIRVEIERLESYLVRAYDGRVYEDINT